MPVTICQAFVHTVVNCASCHFTTPVPTGRVASLRAPGGCVRRLRTSSGVALTAAAAQRGGAEAATATAQLVQERERQPVAAHADRVTEGDGATVDVDDLVADAELGHRGDADGGERLVDLEQVDVGDGYAGALERP